MKLEQLTNTDMGNIFKKNLSFFGRLSTKCKPLFKPLLMSQILKFVDSTKIQKLKHLENKNYFSLE